MRWKTYPEYKDSGVEWLSEIPEGWEVRRLKTVSRFGYGDSLSNDDRIPGDYNVYGSNGIVGQHEYPNTKGPCIVVGRKGSFGKITFSENPCFAIDTTYYIDSTQTRQDLRWLFYCLQLLKLDSFSKDSAVLGLSREDAYGRYAPYCNIQEQRAIATFLDREAGRIDALIETKERQIELLKEKRAALISHAVTKGLNPKVKMKPSGIEWLGEIPEHWEVRRLKYLASITTGAKDTINRIEDGEYPFFVRSQLVERINTFSYDGEAVLTAGDGVGVGKVFHYVNGKFDFHQRVYKFSDFKDILGKFFFYLRRLEDQLFPPLISIFVYQSPPDGKPNYF